MKLQEDVKTEKTCSRRDCQENTSKLNYSWDFVVARGAGFEPARPVRTTGLAGLPPTRLGQPRSLLFYRLRVI